MDDAVYHTRTKYVIFSKQHAVVLNGRLRLRNCLGVDPMSLGDLDSLPYDIHVYISLLSDLQSIVDLKTMAARNCQSCQ